MQEFLTMLGAVAVVVIPVAAVQARNTRLSIDNAIKAVEKTVMGQADALYVRKEVCDVRMANIIPSHERR